MNERSDREWVATVAFSFENKNVCVSWSECVTERAVERRVGQMNDAARSSLHLKDAQLNVWVISCILLLSLSYYYSFKPGEATENKPSSTMTSWLQYKYTNNRKISVHLKEHKCVIHTEQQGSNHLQLKHLQTYHSLSITRLMFYSSLITLSLFTPSDQLVCVQEFLQVVPLLQHTESGFCFPVSVA